MAQDSSTRNGVAPVNRASGRPLWLRLLPAGLIFIFAAISWMLYLEEQGSAVYANSATQESSLSQAGAMAYAGKDWQLNNLAGESIQLSSFQGQPVILVFWATWCPYCKKLLPGMQALHEKYSDKGLKIIAVNIREDWKPAVYWRNHEYTFDALLEGDEIAEIYGVSGTPTTVFIDPDGKVLAVRSFSDPEHPALEEFARYFTRTQP